jgi:hypothetical protein
MLAGPKRAVSGPKRAAPVGPGHRGQLARLIRERPVFVNVAGASVWSPSKWRNFVEYIDLRGVFKRTSMAGPRAAHWIPSRRALDSEAADIIEL